jgi:hypothetical protein
MGFSIGNALTGFERAVPTKVTELKESLHTLFRNKSHVKKVEVNLTTSHLEVSLDWLAHTKVDDFYLPLKRSKLHEAKELAEKMIHAMDAGFEPSDAQIQELYDMIDPSGQ